MNGYRVFSLTTKSISKCFLAHRLVANAFIENPNDFPCVNHKNEVKTDNRVENLEWCTHYENNHYGTAETKNYKPVIGISIIDGSILNFDSIKEAAEYLGITASNIGLCCKGIRKKTGGYRWNFI